MGKYISCNDMIDLIAREFQKSLFVKLVHLKCVHSWQVSQEIDFWLRLQGLTQLIQEYSIGILKVYTIKLLKN